MADTAQTPDQVAAYLAEAKRAAATGPIADGRRLVAALEAVLAQHPPGRIVILGALCSKHENHRHFSITSMEAADVAACQECAATVYGSCAGCGPQMPLDSCRTRKAISAELLGEGSGNAGT